MHKEDINLFVSLLNRLLDEEKKEAVIKPLSIQELSENLDLKLNEEGVSGEKFEQALSQLVLNTPRTSTNRFFNQLYGGRNSKATLGELFSVLLNSSMYTYKLGGPMIAIEREIVQKICQMAGYDSNAYGTMATGGSMTNYMALIMARDFYDTSIRSLGVRDRMVMYTSKESHYSNKKNASFAGIGQSNIRFIDSNDRGEIETSKLEEQIKKDIDEGLNPFFINGTIGTTVLGAIDDLHTLSSITAKYKIWLHADAAFYGSMLFSSKYKNLLTGIEKTDSFSINIHKMLSTPITCSLVLTRHKHCLYESFGTDAEYLYQGDEDDWNPGKISFQCGRRNDALKLWTLWKSIGSNGIAKMVENEFYLADVAREYIKSNSNYTLYNFENALTLCFNYKNIPADKLCAKLYEEGKIMVGYGQFREDRFVRFVTINSHNSKEEILDFFRLLEEFAELHFEN